MRNLLTNGIASLALAIILAGSASAADRLDTPVGTTGDAAESWLYRAPLGEVASPGNDIVQSVADRLHTPVGTTGDAAKSWLYRAPQGEVISPGDDNESASAPDRLDTQVGTTGDADKSRLYRAPRDTEAAEAN